MFFLLLSLFPLSDSMFLFHILTHSVNSVLCYFVLNEWEVEEHSMLFITYDIWCIQQDMFGVILCFNGNFFFSFFIMLSVEDFVRVDYKKLKERQIENSFYSILLLIDLQFYCCMFHS